jgi:AcrR family transcriptional regulator
MPSETFNNLPSLKRERIIQKCYEEFSVNSYREASISKIVSDLGIAKGSIYKYFKDKQALYFYMIEQAVQTKLTAVKKQLTGKNDFLWEIMHAGTIFDIQYPLISGFLIRVLSDSYTFETDIRTQILAQSKNFLIGYVQQQQAIGEIRTDIETQTLALYINMVLTNVGSMLAANHSTSLDEFLQYARNSSDAKSALLDELDDIYKLIKSGITP